jgi:hypothetical protein
MKGVAGWQCLETRNECGGIAVSFPAARWDVKESELTAGLIAIHGFRLLACFKFFHLLFSLVAVRRATEAGGNE